MTTGKTMVDGLENRIISTQLCRGDQFWPEAGGWMELWVAVEGVGVGTTLSRQHYVNHSYIRVTESRRLVTAAAKWLQLCPTLCDPTDGSPSGSVPGILQARTLECVAIYFSSV